MKFFIEFKLKENVTDYSFESSIDLLRGDNSPLNLMKVEKLGVISNSMFGVFFREMRRISNLPLCCPLLAVSVLLCMFPNCLKNFNKKFMYLLLQNKLYYFKNHTIIPDTFPPITLSMQWFLELKIFQNQKYVGTLFFHGKS